MSYDPETGRTVYFSKVETAGTGFDVPDEVTAMFVACCEGILAQLESVIFPGVANPPLLLSAGHSLEGVLFFKVPSFRGRLPSR